MLAAESKKNVHVSSVALEQWLANVCPCSMWARWRQSDLCELIISRCLRIKKNEHIRKYYGEHFIKRNEPLYSRCTKTLISSHLHGPTPQPRPDNWHAYFCIPVFVVLLTAYCLEETESPSLTSQWKDRCDDTTVKHQGQHLQRRSFQQSPQA